MMALHCVQTCLVELVEGDRYEDSKDTRGRGRVLDGAGRVAGACTVYTKNPDETSVLTALYLKGKCPYLFR